MDKQNWSLLHSTTQLSFTAKRKNVDSTAAFCTIDFLIWPCNDMHFNASRNSRSCIITSYAYVNIIICIYACIYLCMPARLHVCIYSCMFTLYIIFFGGFWVFARYVDEFCLQLFRQTSSTQRAKTQNQKIFRPH